MDCRRILNSSRNHSLDPNAPGFLHPNMHPPMRNHRLAQVREGRKEEESPSPVVFSNQPPQALNQTLQQIFQLSDLMIDGEGSIGNVQDFDGQKAFVVMAGELGNDSAVFNLTLPDLNLELLHRSTRVAKVNVADVRENDVIILALMRSGQEMARVQSQA